MNTKNLIIGKVYENYPSLCAVLDESIKSSDSKTAQLKEWRRYFEYERIGHKYKITKIYDTPLPKHKSSRIKISKYSKFLYPIVINELHQKSIRNDNEPFPKLQMQRFQLIEKFGFIKNIDFIKSNKIHDMFNLSYLDSLIFDELLSDYNGIANQVFNRTMYNLTKTNTLICKERHFVIDNDYSRLANYREETLIQENLIVAKHKFSKSMLYYLNAERLYYKELYKELNKLLKKENIAVDSSIWEIALPQPNSKGIQNDYNALFGGMTNINIQIYLYRKMDSLRKELLPQIRHKTNKATLNTYNMMPKEIFDKKNNIYMEYQKLNSNNAYISLPDEFIEAYRQRRNELTNILV